MKKIISITMVAILSLSVFTACSKGETPSYDVKEIVTKIDAAVPVNSPQDLQEDILTIMMGLDMADIKSYAGKTTTANVSADQIIIIEAVEGKVDTIKAALEEYKNGVSKSFEMYLPEQFEKANAGRLIVKGNYVLLVIAGDDNILVSDGAEKAYEAVDKAIDEAFK